MSAWPVDDDALPESLCLRSHCDSHAFELSPTESHNRRCPPRIDVIPASCCFLHSSESFYPMGYMLMPSEKECEFILMVVLTLIIASPMEVIYADVLSDIIRVSAYGRSHTHQILSTPNTTVDDALPDLKFCILFIIPHTSPSPPLFTSPLSSGLHTTISRYPLHLPCSSPPFSSLLFCGLACS